MGTDRPGLLVADASAVVAALGPSLAGGDWAAALLDGPRLAAPQLMPYEAAGAFRRFELSGTMSSADARAAHHDLFDLEVDLWSHRRLGVRAWELRHSVAYADACYVALAELLDCPLVTLDERLARAPGPRCAFRTPE